MTIEVRSMKKFLLLLALAGSATTLASMQAVGSIPAAPTKSAANLREARACAALLKRMARSSEADSWQNRMRAWTCMERAESAGILSTEAD
jgi:hypothetical protein